MPSLADRDPIEHAPSSADILKELAEFPAWATSRHPGVTIKDKLDIALVLVKKAEGVLQAMSTYAGGKMMEANDTRRMYASLRMEVAIERAQLIAIRGVLDAGEAE